MSDYQVTNYGICGECKWHKKQMIVTWQEHWVEKEKISWACNNRDSDYYALITDYTDTCPMFQERGIEK